MAPHRDFGTRNHGDHPGWLVPVLRRIWTATFGRDTTALTAALLARDWSG